MKMLHERLAVPPIIETFKALTYPTCKSCSEDITLGHYYLKNYSGPYCMECINEVFNALEVEIEEEECEENEEDEEDFI